MKDFTHKDLAVVLVFSAFMMVMWFLQGWRMGQGFGRAIEHEAAIEAGVGRWVVSPTGEKRFVYGDAALPEGKP